MQHLANKVGSVIVKHNRDDMYTSIDQLVNKLDAQVKKHKEKLNNHRKN
jgi:putative sigma-54 modulation protein